MLKTKWDGAEEPTINNWVGSKTNLAQKVCLKQKPFYRHYSQEIH